MIALPWCLKLEMTRGCNLKCSFCPISVLPDLSENKKFLTPDSCEIAAKEYATLAPESRIELTMRGEPTLNPDLLINLKILRKVLPKIQISMFSNGVVFFKNPTLISDIISSGVNILNIDCYNNTYERFKEIATKKTNLQVEDFRTFSCYKRHNKGHLLKVVNLVPDIKDPKKLVNVREIHNMAGNAPNFKKLLEPLKKKCARPFREFVISYDLNVLICCHDWNTDCKLGNLRNKSAKEIWYGTLHKKILEDLYDKNRNGKPCNQCDYMGGYRLGFLKNPRSKA